MEEAQPTRARTTDNREEWVPSAVIRMNAAAAEVSVATNTDGKTFPLPAMGNPISWAEPLRSDQFADRVKWAVRRGRPQWLWPEVGASAWQDALDAIAKVTARVLAGGKCVTPLEAEERALSVAAYTSGMGPLLGYWLQQGLLEARDRPAAVLARHYQDNSRRMEALVERTWCIVESMRKRAIPVTILKGMDTAFSCFPTIATRPLCDIDLFVDPTDKKAAEVVLESLGYSPEHAAIEPDEQFWRHHTSARTPRSLMLVHRADPWGIDLHTSTNRRFALGAPLIHLDKLIRAAGPARWSANDHARVLAPAAGALFLAVHASCGLGNLRMLRLVELVLLVRKAEESGCLWRDLLELGELTSTLPHAYAALKLAGDLAPGTIPDHVLRRAHRDLPRDATKVIGSMTPATAHAISRCSVEERYMWTSSLRGKIKQAAHDLIPLEMPGPMIFPTLKRRMLRVLHGTLNGDNG